MHILGRNSKDPWSPFSTKSCTVEGHLGQKFKRPMELIFLKRRHRRGRTSVTSDPQGFQPPRLTRATARTPCPPMCYLPPSSPSATPARVVLAKQIAWRHVPVSKLQRLPWRGQQGLWFHPPGTDASSCCRLGMVNEILPGEGSVPAPCLHAGVGRAAGRPPELGQAFWMEGESHLLSWTVQGVARWGSPQGGAGRSKSR